jgi:hypothetical protein
LFLTHGRRIRACASGSRRNRSSWRAAREPQRSCTKRVSWGCYFEPARFAPADSVHDDGIRAVSFGGSTLGVSLVAQGPRGPRAGDNRPPAPCELEKPFPAISPTSDALCRDAGTALPAPAGEQRVIHTLTSAEHRHPASPGSFLGRPVRGIPDSKPRAPSVVSGARSTFQPFELR